MFRSASTRRAIGGAAAAALIAALAVLAAPIPASAATYDTFEIESYSWDDLHLLSVEQPGGNGWGPPPPSLVESGARRHFGVAQKAGTNDRSTVTYAIGQPRRGTLVINTNRGPGGDSSSCMTKISVYVCRVVPSTAGSNTKFILELDHPTKPWTIGELYHPDEWATRLASLCLRPSLATCRGPNFDPQNAFGNWHIGLGTNLSIDLDWVWWEGRSTTWASGYRGMPYAQLVGTPNAMKSYGFTTVVTGLPQGLAYYPEYDKILGTPTGAVGTTVATISLMSGTTVLSSSARTITIEQTAPPIVVK